MRSALVEIINRRRRQLLVHSCLYYMMDVNRISDQQFDTWAKELYKLQLSFPDVASECINAEEFKEFNGCSGFDLPFRQPWVIIKAIQLRR